VALPAIRPRAETETEGALPPRTAPLPETAKPEKRRRRRVSAGPILALMLVACVLGGLWLASRAVYFVGTERDGRTIAIFRGLPYDLPLGIHLYERYAGSGTTVDQVAPSRRSVFTDHKLRSRNDAANLVIALERGQLSR
jgi:protein phosphatase